MPPVLHAHNRKHRTPCLAVRVPHGTLARMKHRFVCWGLAASAALALAAPDPFATGVRTTEPLAPAEQQKTFKLPPGFEIQLIAAEPELRKPMNMAFDAAGFITGGSTTRSASPRRGTTSTASRTFGTKPSGTCVALTASNQRTFTGSSRSANGASMEATIKPSKTR